MDRIHVDDGHSTDAELSPRPEAATTARAMIEPLGERLHDDVVERAKLLVTEVVANSVVHGSATEPIRVSVEARPGTLCVQVTDRGHSFHPEARTPTAESASGWGLFLVDSLSDRWGVHPSGSDVTVWFELDL